jgi:phosphotransacetylase/acyl dehydratase
MNNAPTPELLENRTYEELQPGDSASLTRTLTKDDIDVFAILSGDVNPAHLDEAYARETPFNKVIAHGMWGGTLISTILGTRLPGPGTIYVGQTLRFMRPVRLGDVITVTVTVKEKRDKQMVLLGCECTNQQGKTVITGEAEVMAPAQKVRRESAPLPELQLRRHQGFDQLMSLAQTQSAIRCAVIYPTELHTLHAALDAAKAGLIQPLLVGPRTEISALALAHGLDLSACDWQEAATAEEAADHSVDLAHAGRVQALMQGHIEVRPLLQSVLSHGGGLRTDGRISHAYVADVPGYGRPLIITDAEVHIHPSLEDKRDIIRNAVDLARILGITPRVAILSATQSMNTNLSSSIDAVALCKMFGRAKHDALDIDGPLPFDAAVSPEVAQLRHPTSTVAGHANILVAPNLETGNLLVKQLAYMASADVTGIVLGAKVPVILTNPTDNERTRVASAALAVLLSQRAQADADGAPQAA